MRLAVLALCLAALAVPAAAQVTPSGLPVPRFVSLKFAEVNGRSGPSDQHPILWTYHRRGLPMQVVAETENWRRVQDPDGVLVWVHKRVLDGRFTVVATADTPLLERPDPDSAPKAVAEAGVILQVRACRGEWRRVSAGDFNGWARAGTLWGADCSNGEGQTADVSALQAGLEQ